MVKRLLLPQEIETFYVIPSIRKYLAIAMKKNGMRQKDIAEIMMVNSAAISQYTSQKRGNKVTFGKEIKSEIEKSAKMVVDQQTYVQETQRLLRVIRTSCTLCEIQKKYTDLSMDCSPEIMNCKEEGM
jgi:predicted transcriptional regulator